MVQDAVVGSGCRVKVWEVHLACVLFRGSCSLVSGGSNVCEAWVDTESTISVWKSEACECVLPLRQEETFRKGTIVTSGQMCARRGLTLEAAAVAGPLGCVACCRWTLSRPAG
eukprot:359718-Chlamydomonas_euryale.AAC.8